MINYSSFTLLTSYKFITFNRENSTMHVFVFYILKPGGFLLMVVVEREAFYVDGKKWPQLYKPHN